MITTLIHTFTIAMSSPFSADVSVHLDRCRSPVIEIKPQKPVIVFSCGSKEIVVDCSRKDKFTTSLLDERGLYLGHVQCRRK